MDFFDVYHWWMISGIIIVIVGCITLGTIKKKSVYPFVSLLFFIIFLVLHIIAITENVRWNIIVDFCGVAISITSYLIINEIEIRRQRISKVFENRYKEETQEK